MMEKGGNSLFTSFIGLQIDLFPLLLQPVDWISLAHVIFFSLILYASVELLWVFEPNCTKF